jgi:hypothetical protein
MKLKFTTQQAGYALILMVLALMGLGGTVLAGFTQQAKKDLEVQRYQHNQRVLVQAKQALLMFAYNYPVTSNLGPGRLPNADTNNDGTSDGGATFGRLPWDQPNLNLYDIRDADGQSLWYAVSSSFRPQAAAINSDTSGTITLRDQSGNIIFDGSNPASLPRYGVAAVIIAPGASIDRNGVAQNWAADVNDPENYLDLVFGTEDNSDFTNGSDTDGLILGPVNDLTNDQFIVITAAEVIAMAEKAVLATYRDAINDYINNIGVEAYPWLDDYTTFDLTLFDGDVGTRIGRVPSIFANHFAPTPENLLPSQAITSDLEMLDGQPLNVNGQDVPTIFPGVISANAAVQFSNNGDLVITPSVNGASISQYYWDEAIGADGWLECLPVVTGTELDCNQALAALGVPDSSIVPNEVETRVVRVTYTNNLVAAAPFIQPFAGSDGFDPQYLVPTAGAHARVTLEYAEAIPDAIGVDYDYEESYLAAWTPVSGSVNYSLGVTYYPELPDWARTNLWHDSVMMAYAEQFGPGGTATCTPEDGNILTLATDDCLVMTNLGGTNNDITALLVLAGEHDFLDGDDLNDDGDYVDLNEVLPDGDFSNDLYDIFETENYSGIGAYPVPNNDPDPGTDTGWGLVFDKREDIALDGNVADTLFVIDQL